MLIHKATQTIQTKRLTLRQFLPEDAQAMFDNWANDARVTKYMPWPPHENIEKSIKCVNDWIDAYQKPQSYHWAIVYEGRPIGSINVVSMSEKSEWCEIGYCIGYAYWNRGIMTEALSSVINFLFCHVNVHRIQATFNERNIGSGRVMQKCGMTNEGRLRKHAKNLDGTFSDVLIYGMLKEEWSKGLD